MHYCLYTHYKEIFAEKVRSLFERTRPKDLYDVWYLSKVIEIERAAPIIRKKLKHRGIEFRIEQLLKRSLKERGHHH